VARKSKTPDFKVGDRVAYSVQWLRSVGMTHTTYGRARGEVTAVKPFGDAVLVSIDWREGEGADRVLSANLAHVGANSRFAAC
jgi:ribosomal protein L21E